VSASQSHLPDSRYGFDLVGAVTQASINTTLKQLIAPAFTGAYFTQLRQTGEPVLGYSFTVDAPRCTTLELGSVSRECWTLLDSQGQPVTNPPSPSPNATAQQEAIIQAQQHATTLVYIGTHSTTPPVPVPFSWN
jgi:hypothetical protein